MSKLPKNWANVSIYDVLQPQSDKRLIHQGWSPLCENEPSRSDSEWGVLKTTSIQDGAFLPSHNKRLPISLTPREKLEVKNGDILLTCAGPRIRCGVASLVRESRPKLIISGKMYRFRTNPELADPRYLEAYLRAPATKARIDRMKTGISESGMNITHEKFSEIVIPIAPIAEQKLIADKLDRLLLKVNACKERLNRVSKILTRYRQSVLTAATSGKLTEDWREHFSKKTQDHKTSIIWNENKLVDLCLKGRVVTYGVIKLGEEIYDGIPCLRTSNVRWLGVELQGLKRIASKLSGEYSRTILQGNEVLVNVRGTLGGVAAVTPEMIGWNVSREVAVVPVDNNKAITQFLTLWIASDTSQRWLRKAEKGVAYVGINIEDLRNLPVNLPIIEEQEEISRRVNILFSYADGLETRLLNALTAIDRLTPALLAKAFRGELLPQDPDDEAVADLLKRIASQNTVKTNIKSTKKAF